MKVNGAGAGEGKRVKGKIFKDYVNLNLFVDGT